jgi:molybdate transport system substrate-binding protein
VIGRRPVAVLTSLVLVVLTGCGGSSSSTSGGKPDLTVSAAASLKAAFTRYAAQFPAATARFSFAGSDVLAAQIEQGIRPDVFASANMKLPAMLHTKGLLGTPVEFAANKLVLAVPAGSKIRSLTDIQKRGVTLAVGSASVPIGSYTRTVLARLGPAASAKILANVRSEEPDVSGIVGKLTQGAVDAGFTYVTDVQATNGKLTAIALPASLQPVVTYGVAIVTGSSHPAQARQFIAGLLSGQGRTDLREAGFLPRPAK